MSDTKTGKLKENFLGIMGRASSKVGAVKDIKAARKKAEQARATLTPWYTPGGLLKTGKFKSLAETGWMPTEHAQFQLDVAEAETALRGDSPDAGAFTRAVQAAQAADEAKATRQRASEEINSAGLLFNKITGHPEFKALEAAHFKLKERLAQGAPGEADKLLADAEELASTIEDLVGAPPAKSRLEQDRADRHESLVEMVIAEDKRLGKMAYDLLPKGRVVFIEAEVRARLTQLTQPLVATLSKANDQSGLDDAAQGKNLQQRFEAAKKGIEAAVKTMEQKIGDQGGASLLQEVAKGQADIAKGQDIAAAAAAYRESFEQVERALAALLDQNPPGAQAMADQIRGDSARLLSGNAFALGDAFIARSLDEVAKARAAATAASTGAGAALQAKIGTLRSSLGKAMKPAGSRMKPAFEALIAEVNQLETVVRTGNTGAFVAADQRLQAIQAAGIGGAAAIAAFGAMADRVDAVVKDKRIRKEFKPELDALQLAARTVMDTQLDLQNLGPAQAAMTSLDQEAAALRAQFDALVQWRALVQPRLVAMAKQLVAFKKGSPAAGVTTYEQDVKAVRDGYEEPGVDRVAMERSLAAAEQGLATLTGLLRTQPDAAAAQLELDALVVTGRADLATQQTTDAAQIKTELTTDIANFRTMLTTTETAVKTVKGDAEELAELKELFAQVRKKFKSGDLDGARQQLRSIQPRLNALHDTPGGVVVQRIDQLKQIGARWDEALNGMHTEMTGIAVAAEDVARAAGLDAPEVRSRVMALHKGMLPFRTPLVRNTLLLVDEKLALPARKAAREGVLADVRSIRAALAGNPLVSKLDRNPFGKASPFTPLRRLLASVDETAQRAVPPE